MFTRSDIQIKDRSSPFSKIVLRILKQFHSKSHLTETYLSAVFPQELRPFWVKTVQTISIERNVSFTVKACDIQVRKINRAAFKIVADSLEAIGPRYLALLNGPLG